MPWTEEVHRNRLQVARASGQGKLSAQRRLPPPAQPPQPNSGLGAIALVAGLVAGAVAWNREGRKLRGRQLPPWLEPLRPLFKLASGGGGSGRRTTSSAGAARPQQRPQQPQAPQLADRARLAAAAEARFKVGALAGLAGSQRRLVKPCMPA